MSSAVTALLCGCGHPTRLHLDSGDGPCNKAGCGCSGFHETTRRPPATTGQTQPPHVQPMRQGPAAPTPAPSAAPPPPPTPVSRRSLLARAEDSPDPKVRKLGQKAEALLLELANALDVEDRRAATRARIAELDTERARLMAEAGIEQPRREKQPRYKGDPIDCPYTGCHTVAASPQGLAAHVRMRHPDQAAQ